MEPVAAGRSAAARPVQHQPDLHGRPQGNIDEFFKSRELGLIGFLVRSIGISLLEPDWLLEAVRSKEAIE